MLDGLSISVVLVLPAADVETFLHKFEPLLTNARYSSNDDECTIYNALEKLIIETLFYTSLETDLVVHFLLLNVDGNNIDVQLETDGMESGTNNSGKNLNAKNKMPSTAVPSTIIHALDSFPVIHTF